MGKIPDYRYLFFTLHNIYKTVPDSLTITIEHTCSLKEGYPLKKCQLDKIKNDRLDIDISSEQNWTKNIKNHLFLLIMSFFDLTVTLK